MTNNTTYRLHGDFRRLLPQAIGAAEGRAEVGFPASGTSGLSVGGFQIDLGARADERKRFIDAGVRSGAIQDRAEAERLFAIRFDAERMKVGTPEREQFDRDSQRAKEIAQAAMARPEVRAVVDRATARQAEALEAATRRVCGQAGPQARAFCASPRGQLEVAAYLHQFGADDTKSIEAFMRGETVTLGRGAEERQVRIQGDLDSEQFRNGYQGSTRWGQTNRRGLDTRHENLDRFLRQQGIDDGSRARINPGRRSDAGAGQTQTAEAEEPVRNWVVGLEPSPSGGTQIVWGTQDEYDAARAKEDAASQQSAQSNEGTRERSANMNASFAQPVASRVTWRPDPAKLQDAIASVGAQDLPGWTQNLLGRDVMANGAKRAVEGFQRTINDVNRPVPFDYRWGFDKRNGRVDVDGDLGPQTRSGFGRAIDKEGEDGFKKLYALDQFGRYVKAVDYGRAKIEDLEDSVAGTLGQAQRDAAARFQTSLNKFHDDREERGERLKIDGWIGPKTTEDFRTTLYRVGSDRLNERFDRDDFWNDEDLA